MSARTDRRSAGAVFAWPGLIAGISLFGLIIALIADGAVDIAGWLALAVPVGAVVWARLRRT
ncbi:hypothetical protein ACWCOP_02340 [Maricaulaceae bacterium MS644]